MKATVLLLFSFLILETVLAASRNQTNSAYGMALTYNTHLKDHDPEQGREHGTPVIQGYFHILGDNKTVDGVRMQPDWTTNNVLRVCMEFYNKKQGSFNRESIRWVLNYTYPKNFTNYTLQMAKMETDFNDTKEWCSQPHNYEKIIMPDGMTIADKNNATKLASTDTPTGGRRRLTSWFEKRLLRLLQTDDDAAAEAA